MRTSRDQIEIKEYVTPYGAVRGIKTYCKKYLGKPNSQDVLNEYFNEVDPEVRKENYVGKCIAAQKNFSVFVEWCKEKYEYHLKSELVNG